MKPYSKYKDSGISWLGQIPEHWDIIKAKHILTPYNIKVGERSREYDLLSLTLQGIIKRDMENPTGKFPASFDTYQEVHPGDFVFCLFDNEETPRTVGLSEYFGMITGAYDVFRCERENVNSKYLLYYYLTIDDKKHMKPLYRGLRKTIPYNSFMRYGIPVPPRHEQDKIVEVIDKRIADIDNYIATKTKELDLLREYITSLIYCNSPTETIDVTSWENCFPSSWNLKSGRMLFEEIDIKGISNERYLAVTQDNGLIYKDVEGVNFVTSEKKETQKLVCEGQFVISLRSFEGGIEYSFLRGLVSPAYVVLQLRKQYDTLPMRMYYRFLFKSRPFVTRLNHISDSLRDGKSIKFADIRNFLFPVPEEERLYEIFKHIQVFDIKKNALDSEKRLFKEYKQRLIADAVTGAINVQE